ncbi:MAG: hypothetical protein R3B46_05180 [Phycisphaerales bacterium]
MLIAMKPASFAGVFAKVGSLILFFATLAAMLPFSFGGRTPRRTR